METKTKKRFVVDRRTWSRGEINQPSYLLNARGHKCCLGFICEQCGVPKKIMLASGTPQATSLWEFRNVIGFLLDDEVSNASHTVEAVRVNDNRTLNDTEREAKLIAIFAGQNIDLVFEN